MPFIKTLTALCIVTLALPSIAFSATKDEIADLVRILETRSMPLQEHQTDTILGEPIAISMELRFDKRTYRVARLYDESKTRVLIIQVAYAKDGVWERWGAIDIGMTGTVSAVLRDINTEVYVAQNVLFHPPVNLEYEALGQAMFDTWVREILQLEKFYKGQR